MGPQKHLFVWVVTICDNLLKFRFSLLESEVVRNVVVVREPPDAVQLLENLQALVNRQREAKRLVLLLACGLPDDSP